MEWSDSQRSSVDVSEKEQQDCCVITVTSACCAQCLVDSLLMHMYT